MKKHLAIICLVSFVYYLLAGILNLYFQQDEWRTYATYIELQSFGGITSILKYYSSPTAGHYTPIASFVNYYLFRLFSLNSVYWLLSAVALHSIISCLVYQVAKKIGQNSKQAFWTAIIFSAAFAGNQAVTWIAASTNTLLATAFAFISLWFFLDYLKSLNNKRFYLSAVFLFVSFLCKEIALGLLPFYLVLTYGTKKTRKTKHIYIKILSLGLAYVLFRVLLIFLPSTSPEVNLITADNNKLNYLFNFVLYPIKAISQTIIPVNASLGLMRSLFRIGIHPGGVKLGTTAADIFINKYMLTVWDFLIFILISSLTYIKRKNKLIMYGYFFIILNSLIYILSPERSGKLVAIDSRNLYLPMLGSSLILGSISKKKLPLIAIVIVLFNFTALRSSLNNSSIYAKQQKRILNKIHSDNPVISNKSIFYITSDTPYFGMAPEDKTLPFQNGFGKTLLVSYYPDKIFPPSFYEHEFLWDLLSEGYRQEGDYLFGYYRTEERFNEFRDSHQDDDINYYIYKYHGKTDSLYKSKEMY